MGSEAGNDNEEHDPGALYLGEVRADEPAGTWSIQGEPQTARPGRRWMVMVAAFLVGALVGGYAWLARSDLLDSARISLIVTDVTHDAPLSDGTLTSVSVVVRNMGGTDVTITSASLPGQPSAGDRGVAESPVPAGGTAVVALSGELHCGEALPDSVEAEVRTPGGVTSTRLAMHRTDVSNTRLCSGAGPDDVWIESVRPGTGPAVAPLESTESGLDATLPLSIRSWGVSEVEIVDVAVSTGPGLDVEPSGIVGRHETRTVADLRLEWTVTECLDAYRPEPIEITIVFADHPSVRVSAPENMQYMLVGMRARVCDL